MSDIGIFCSYFKASEFIDGYLENMLQQTIFEKVNFYFLDCASPCDSYEKIESLSKNHKNIFLKRLESDPGLYAGWNVCVDWMKEDFIGNWNADDRKSPWSLEVLRDFLLSNDDVDLVYGKTFISRIANEGFFDLRNKEYYPCLTHSFKNLLLNNSPHCMPLWRKRIHEKHGKFDETLKTAADTDMWLRACKGGSKMSMLNEDVGVYFENPNGRSTKPETLKEMIEEVNYVRSRYYN